MQNSQKRIPHLSEVNMAEKEIEFDMDGGGVRGNIDDVSLYSKPLSVEFTKYGTVKFVYTNEFDVKRILQSGDRVIVFWGDGSKTIVKRSADTIDDVYSAFTAALAIKVYGNNSQVKRLIDRKHEHIEKCDGKSRVIDNYEMRKQRRKWEKEREKNEQKSN